VGVVTAGTGDIPVAEEAAGTLEVMGATVQRIFDVGVAGLHRLMYQRDALARCDVLIAVAGMEGALPPVVTGLVDVPVIAVPTSIGYGANLGGVTAMLGMLTAVRQRYGSRQHRQRFRRRRICRFHSARSRPQRPV
jgi:NCAIR mutase (PurE)-related protein